MPESVTDRPTRGHEYLFLLTKSAKYYYDHEAVKEAGIWPAGTRAAKGSGEREGNRRGTRKNSITFQMCQIAHAGIDSPRALIVPPGVVHAYRNIGDMPGLVVNCPNRLYRGHGGKHRIDEIRHEGSKLFPME